MNNLDTIAEGIHAHLTAINDRRDTALKQSRDLIRHCSQVIRNVHQNKWDEVEQGLQALHTAADELRASVDGYPELEHTGYTQDALKEYAEAILTLALIKGDDTLPTPEELNVLPSTYLNGLTEAASEMRRYILRLLTNNEINDVKRLLAAMDEAYTVVFSFGYPDAVTGGLRRRVDQLRGVLERTRGDVTTSIRQERLLTAMRDFETRFDVDTEA
jgi:translin